MLKVIMCECVCECAFVRDREQRRNDDVQQKSGSSY